MPSRDWMNGMFVGFLNDHELAEFERLVEQGVAYRSYEGAGGFMGLAKVRFRPPSPQQKGTDDE